MPARQGLYDLATPQPCICFSFEIIFCIEGHPLTLFLAEDDFELPVSSAVLGLYGCIAISSVCDAGH